MTEPVDMRQIKQTLIGQLESEVFLGALWLPWPRVDAAPIEDVGAPPADVPVAEHQTEFTTPLEGSHMTPAEKSRRLRDIADSVARCTKCELHKSRTNTVPGEGNPDARLVFVGEAPGQTEDEQGRPFVGRAGKLLTNIIEAMGLTREDVFICNILKCRPPGNRDPQAHEIVCCTPYLHEQLQILQPEVIVALGAHAARTLLDTNESIGKLRGRFHEYVPGPMAEPIKLLPTYHPAYLLRNYSNENRARVWQDMQLVLKELGLPIPRKKKEQ